MEGDGDWKGTYPTSTELHDGLTRTARIDLLIIQDYAIASFVLMHFEIYLPIHCAMNNKQTNRIISTPKAFWRNDTKMILNWKMPFIPHC